MANLPRIVLEPVDAGDRYKITVEESSGAERRVTPDEVQRALGEVLQFDTGGASAYRVTVGRIDPNSIHWSDLRLKTDVRPL